MTAITETKKIRAIMANRYKMDKKVLGYKDAQPREYHEFKDPKFGHTIGVLLSPGQRINMYKYERRSGRK